MSNNKKIALLYSIAAVLTAIAALICAFKAKRGMFAILLTIQAMCSTLAYVYYSKDKRHEDDK